MVFRIKLCILQNEAALLKITKEKYVERVVLSETELKVFPISK
jgi:hypothetical protein